MRVIIDGYAWLDATALNEQHRVNLRRRLTVIPRKTSLLSKREIKPVLMYDESRDGLFGVPRGFYEQTRTDGMNEETLAVSYGYPMSNEMMSGSTYQSDGPYAEQASVLKSFEDRMRASKWGGFILQAGCAFGKTFTMIELARRYGRRTIILVNKEFLMYQWEESIYELCPQARIGFAQADVCDYENRDFVIGMCQSLADKDRYPADFYRSFGVVITDEVHRISASTWASIVPMFTAAWKIGVSATPRRKDGTEQVFLRHIGQIGYVAKTKSMVPGIRKVFTTAILDPVRRGPDEIPVNMLADVQVEAQLSRDAFRTRQIMEDLIDGIKAGCKIIVVSKTLAHLKQMADDLCGLLLGHEIAFPPVIDFYTGSWFTQEIHEVSKKNKDGVYLYRKGDYKTVTRTRAELKKAERANVLFATSQMIEEGFNVPAIDVEVLALPFGDIEQIVGRARRWCMPDKRREKCKHLCPWRWETCEGKMRTMVVDVRDPEIPQAEKKWERRKSFYKSIGAL